MYCDSHEKCDPQRTHVKVTPNKMWGCTNCQQVVGKCMFGPSQAAFICGEWIMCRLVLDVRCAAIARLVELKRYQEGDRVQIFVGGREMLNMLAYFSDYGSDGKVTVKVTPRLVGGTTVPLMTKQGLGDSDYFNAALSVYMDERRGEFEIGRAHV